MKLSELGSNPYIKVLVYGPSGSGKTCFAAGFPTPIEIWDFDGKANSAAFYFKNDPERLSNIEVLPFNKFPKETRIAEFEKRTHAIDKMVKEKKELPFKTLVIDSLTTLTNSIMDDYIYRSQMGIKRALAGVNCLQDYQLLDRHMTQLVSGLMSLDCNVVFIAHIGTEKDENMGTIIKQPLMPGKFAAKLPIYFEEVYVAKVNDKGEHLLQTKSDYQHTCRTQRGLAKEIKASYDAIINKA